MVAGSPSVPSPWPTPLYCAIRPQTRDARVLVEQGQHRLPDRAADILDVHVDPVGTRRRQVGGKIGGTAGSGWRRPVPSESACVRHPVGARTRSPAAYAGWWEVSTCALLHQA